MQNKTINCENMPTSDGRMVYMYLGPKRGQNREFKPKKETKLYETIDDLKKRGVVFKNKNELRNWIISLKFNDGDMIRVRICKPFIRGYCDLSEVSAGSEPVPGLYARAHSSSNCLRKIFLTFS